jgi:hypothetical protein
VAVRSLAVAAVLVVLSVLSSPTTAAAGVAAGSRSGYCTTADPQAVTLVIDYRDLGGGIDIRCVTGLTAGVTGYGVLQAAGVSIAGTVHDGPGFACRINGRPGPTEKVGIPGNPGYLEQCVNTPPTTAFWGYWWANNGGSWTFSQGGAMSHRAVIGGFEGWSFSHNAGAQSNPPPGVEPRMPTPPPTTTKASPSTTHAPTPKPTTPRPTTNAPKPTPTTPRPTTAAPTTARPATAPTTARPATAPSTPHPAGTTGAAAPTRAAGGSTTGSPGADSVSANAPIQASHDESTVGTTTQATTTSQTAPSTAARSSHPTTSTPTSARTATTLASSQPSGQSRTTTSTPTASAAAIGPASTESAVDLPVAATTNTSSGSPWLLTAIAGVLILGGGAAAFLLARRRSGSP